MTIPSGQTSITQHIGNGLADEFDYEFKISDQGELLVTTTDTSGVDTALVVDTDYTVTGVGDDGGGSITLVAGALTTDFIITLEDNVEGSQLTPFGNQSSFFSIKHENAFDKLTRLVKRLFDQTNLSMRLPTTVVGVSTLLPKPEALELMRWNEDALGLENVSPEDVATAVVASSWIVDTFDNGVDFTGDVTTELTLSGSASVKKNTWVYFDGAMQQQSEYSLSLDTITFNSAIPDGIQSVEVRHNKILEVSSGDASTTNYANGLSSLVAEDVQDAVDELDGNDAAQQLLIDGKAPAVHDHDDRYYTETEMDVALALKEKVIRRFFDSNNTAGAIGNLFVATNSDPVITDGDEICTVTIPSCSVGDTLRIGGLVNIGATTNGAGNLALFIAENVTPVIYANHFYTQAQSDSSLPKDFTFDYVVTTAGTNTLSLRVGGQSGTRHLNKGSGTTPTMNGLVMSTMAVEVIPV